MGNSLCFNGYFRYKGKTYLPGTIVKFNRDWLIQHNYPLYKDARDCYSFDDSIIHYGECIYGQFYLGFSSTQYYFERAKDPLDFNRCKSHLMIYGSIEPSMLADAIEELVEIDEPERPNMSIKPKELKKNPRKRWNQVPEVKIGLVIYIILMIASLIFTQPWGAWIVLTVYFVIWSNHAIDEASGNGGPYWND